MVPLQAHLKAALFQHDTKASKRACKGTATILTQH